MQTVFLFTVLRYNNMELQQNWVVMPSKNEWFYSCVK